MLQGAAREERSGSYDGQGKKEGRSGQRMEREVKVEVSYEDTTERDSNQDRTR